MEGNNSGITTKIFKSTKILKLKECPKCHTKSVLGYALYEFEITKNRFLVRIKMTDCCDWEFSKEFNSVDFKNCVMEETQNI